MLLKHKHEFNDDGERINLEYVQKRTQKRKAEYQRSKRNEGIPKIDLKNVSNIDNPTESSEDVGIKKNEACTVLSATGDNGETNKNDKINMVCNEIGNKTDKVETLDKEKADKTDKDDRDVPKTNQTCNVYVLTSGDEEDIRNDSTDTNVNETVAVEVETDDKEKADKSNKDDRDVPKTNQTCNVDVLTSGEKEENKNGSTDTNVNVTVDGETNGNKDILMKDCGVKAISFIEKENVKTDLPLVVNTDASVANIPDLLGRDETH